MSRITNPKHEKLLKSAKPPLNFDNFIGSGISDEEREEFDRTLREIRQLTPQDIARELRILATFPEEIDEDLHPSDS